jgi:hypothetical protein
MIMITNYYDESNLVMLRWIAMFYIMVQGIGFYTTIKIFEWYVQRI